MSILISIESIHRHTLQTDAKKVHQKSENYINFLFISMLYILQATLHLKIRLAQKVMQKQSVEEVKAINDQHKGWINKKQFFYISEVFIPRIFNFKYNVLLKLKLAETSQTSPYVRKLFDFLMNKLVINKYSKNKANQNKALRNRMKSQEKIKFLMRSFQIQYAKLFNKQYKINIEKFNKSAQQSFFNRIEVQEYFLSFMPEMMREKKAYNECRMLEAEHILTEEILISKNRQDYEISNNIKRMQLPWTQNMFTDIQTFGKNWYNSFVITPDKLENEPTNEQI